ncbi:MAG: phage portal protein [Oscillospiraceae bacterium]
MGLLSKIKKEYNIVKNIQTIEATMDKKENDNINTFLDHLSTNNGMVTGGGEWIVDNIYRRLADELCMLKFKDIIRKDNKVLFLEKSAINDILNLRANDLQTSADFLSTFFYQMFRYGNGLAYLDRDSNKNIIGLENIDVTLYDFGFGYNESGSEKYLLLRAKPKNNINSTDKKTKRFTYKGKENNNTEVIAIKYRDVIHMRRSSFKVLQGDKYQLDNDVGNLPTLFNKNIQAQLTEFSKNNSVKGVLSLKGVMGDDEAKERKGKAFFNMLNSSGTSIAIIDDTENFQVLNKEFKPTNSDDIDKMMKYLYAFYGINENIINGTFTYKEYDAFYNATLEPVITKFHQEITYKLIPQKERRYGRMINIVKRSLVGADLNQLTNFMDKAIYHGVMNVNEMRDEMGLSYVNGGDTFYTNANAVELGGSETPKTEQPKKTNSEIAKEMFKNTKDDNLKTVLIDYID